MPIAIAIDRMRITQFCRSHHIVKLSVFGSVIRDDFEAGSDVDVLVEFDPKHIPGLIRLAGMENELSAILGRKVDLLTPDDLHPAFRDEVLATAEPVYVHR